MNEEKRILSFREWKNLLREKEEDIKNLNGQMRTSVGWVLQSVDKCCDRLESPRDYCPEVRGALFLEDPYDRFSVPEELTYLPLDNEEFRLSFLEFLKQWRTVYAEAWEKEQTDELPF